MKKKLTSVLLCAAMAATSLTGAVSVHAEETKELTLWSIATESDAFYNAYNKAIEEYEAAHPGVTIKHETFENESYKTKIKSAVAANELPDIFMSWPGGFSKAFVDAGKALPLDEYYVNYEEELPRSLLGTVIYDDTLYATGMTTSVSALFYNKKMFEENGLTPPTTFDEWKNVCQAFIDKGITPISISAKDAWLLGMTHDALTLKTVGPEKLQKALTGNGQSYDDPDFLEATTRFKELIDMGAFSESAVGLSNDEVSADFYAGKTAMFISGSWMAGLITDNTENPDDFGVVPVPVSEESKDDYMGAIGVLMVGANTDEPELAGNAAFELSRSISHYGYLDGAGLPGWKVDYDDSSVDRLTKEIADQSANATSVTLWFDTMLEADDAGEYLALLQELYVGNIEPADFVAAMAEQLS